MPQKHRLLVKIQQAHKDIRAVKIARHDMFPESVYTHAPARMSTDCQAVAELEHRP